MPADPAATRRLIESLSTHLEDHLATWKSSLVDARRDIEALLAAISDKIPAQAKPLFPEDVVSMMLEDVIPPPPPPETRIVERVVEKIVEKTVPGAAAPADWTLVRGSLSSVESARTQVDVLTRFIAQAATHASRVALLVLRNDRITGWKAMGFDASGGHDESVRSADLGAEEDAFASDVIRAQRSRLAEPPDESAPLRKALGGRPAARTLLVPMVIRDRLAGLVYADELPGEEGRLNEAAIEVLTFVTGLAVDLLAARKKIPSPALTPTGESIEHFRVVAHEAPAARPAPWSSTFRLLPRRPGRRASRSSTRPSSRRSRRAESGRARWRPKSSFALSPSRPGSPGSRFLRLLATPGSPSPSRRSFRRLHSLRRRTSRPRRPPIYSLLRPRRFRSSLLHRRRLRSWTFTSNPSRSPRTRPRRRRRRFRHSHPRRSRPARRVPSRPLFRRRRPATSGRLSTPCAVPPGPPFPLRSLPPPSFHTLPRRPP